MVRRPVRLCQWASNDPILDAVQTHFTLGINLDSLTASCKTEKYNLPFLDHCLGQLSKEEVGNKCRYTANLTIRLWSRE